MNRDKALFTLGSSSTIKTVNIASSLFRGKKHRMSGQRKPSDHAPTIIIRQRDTAAVSPSNRGTDRQSKTQTARFGCIERLKYPVLLGRLDAASMVPDRDADGPGSLRMRR